MFALLFQHFFLSCDHFLYWGYLVQYNHYQDEVYFCELHFHTNLPLAAWKFVNAIAKGIARVAFLFVKTALIPGAIQAWIDAVVIAAEAPALQHWVMRNFSSLHLPLRWVAGCPVHL
ncbi:hypothetical protein PQX77_021517 [Marasmius sp. AFHP31]|nr:hypothetical protein PQX77_021517 [Marasmius sp. AFHP31]